MVGGFFDNNPTFTYVKVKGLTIIYQGNSYVIRDVYTSCKYLYWTTKSPNVLIETNIRPTENATTYLICINNNGIHTEIPHEELIYNFSGLSSNGSVDGGDVSTSMFNTLKAQVDENTSKYTSVSTTIDGINAIIGDETKLEDGTIISNISVLKSNSNEISARIEKVESQVEEGDEYGEIREKVSDALISMLSAISTLHSDFNGYAKQDEVSQDDITQLRTDLAGIMEELPKLQRVIGELQDILLEKGEDIYADDLSLALDYVTARVNSINSNITNALADGSISSNDITNVVQAVGEATTRLNTLKVTCDEILTLGLGGTVFDAYSEMQMTSDRIQTTVSKTYTTKNEFDNLSIDNTNLFRYSKPYLLGSLGVYDRFLTGRGSISKMGSIYALSEGNNELCYSLTTSGADSSYCELITAYRSMKVEQGKTYHFSCDYALSENCKGFKVVIYCGSTLLGTLYYKYSDGTTPLSKIKAEASWVATVTDNVYFTIYNEGSLDGSPSTLYFTNIKFEQGDKATTWTPHPNDVRGSIDSVSDNLANNYSTTTQMNSAIEQKANSIISTVSANYTTKNEFNDLTIGGNNLALNTANSHTTTVRYENGSDTWVNEGHGQWWWHGIKLSCQSSYVISFDYEIDWSGCSSSVTEEIKNSAGVGIGGASVPSQYQYDLNWIVPFKQYGGSNTKGRLVYVLNFRAYPDRDGHYLAFRPFRCEGGADCRGVVITISNFKVEEGNKATAWSPNPNDVINDLSIGGTNLVYNSDFIIGSTFPMIYNKTYSRDNDNIKVVSDGTYDRCIKVTTTSDGIDGTYYDSAIENAFKLGLKVGDVCSYSAYIKADANCTVGMGIQGGGITRCTLFNVTTEWQKIQVENELLDNDNITIRFYTSSQASVFYVTRIKVEKGNKCTDWSRHPLDMSRNYSTTTQMNSAIEQKANSITSTVSATYTTKSEFNNLSIGGTNLYTGSKTLDSTTNQWMNKNSWTLTDETYNGLTVYRRADYYGGLYQPIQLEPETQYVLSAYVKGDGNSRLEVYSNGGTTLTPLNFEKTQIIPSEWTRISVLIETWNGTGSWATNGKIENTVRFENYIQGANFYICGLKLEKGNKATDWSASPLEIDPNYTTKDEFNNLSIGGRNLALGTNQGSENWYWSLGVSGVTTEDYEEDGINCVKFTRDNIDETSWSVVFYKNLNLTALKPSTEYTVTMEVKSSISTSFNCSIRQNNGTEQITTEARMTPNSTVGEWTKLSCVIKTYGEIPLSGQYLYMSCTSISTNQTYMLRNLKVEEGNKATAYTVAPEDINSAIKDAQDTADTSKDLATSNEERLVVAESTIQQLSDSISMLVTDENGTSLMQQTSTGWTFNMSDINSTIEKTAEELNTLSGTVDSNKEVIDGLNKTVSGLADKTSYITMGTANGQPCIELGKEDSDFKVQITNTEMNFLQGSTPIAYVNNESLYIEKAVIKQELQIGETTGWIWATRSNGNMGLRWKG